MSQAPTSHYVKIWVLLLFLFVISVCGPMLEIKVVTLITAFGVAIIKAVIVAKQFMHLNIEKKFITYMLISMLILMGVFFFGTAVDVMSSRGSGWQKNMIEIPLENPEAH